MARSSTSPTRDPAVTHSPVLLGAIQDCGPDRWGRILIERAVRRKVLAQKPYRDIDFVLALDDASRLGTLRFRLDAASPFLAVSLADGRLALAKFPKPDDTRDIAAGEILALTLAAEAGIRVVEHQLVSAGRHSVAVITRIDRAGHARIPFLSGASLLGLSQGDPGAYTLMADAIRQFGHDVAGDLREVLTAVSAWRQTGRRLRLQTNTLDAYASAFEHELMDEARTQLAK